PLEEGIVSMNRRVKFAAVAALGTLGLTACQSGTAVTPGDDGPGPTDPTGQHDTSLACPGGELVGSGSSAQKSAMQKMIAMYTEQCAGTRIEYSSPGSGDGIKAFIAEQVDWAGSDSALKAS